jgi:hypothetical protein
LSLEGSIRLQARWDGRAIRRAAVAAGRTLGAPRLLEGKSAVQAETLVPLVFSVCARAQSVAAARALDAALGRDLPASAADAGELMVRLEWLQEYLWRVLIDAPALVGRPEESGSFAILHRAARALLQRGAGAPGWTRRPLEQGVRRDAMRFGETVVRELEQRVLGIAPGCWLSLASEAELIDWMREAGTVSARLIAEQWDQSLGKSAVALLPLVGPGDLRGALAELLERGDEFSRAPEWEGMPRETGPLARQRSHPLIAAAIQARGNTVGVRLLARLVELSAIAQALASGEGESPGWVRASAIGNGVGCSAVETARGTLVHYVRVAAERVITYRIVAPTEWNFHPRGAFSAGVNDFPAETAARAERALRLMAFALDPCVAYSIELIYTGREERRDA